MRLTEANLFVTAAAVAPAMLLAGVAAAGDLDYAPAPHDNPLKGLVPYSYPNEDRFEWSMEFDYFPLSKLMPAEDRFDWSALDEFLEEASGRGRHAVFRVYLEYPKVKDAFPTWLTDAGVKVTRWKTPDGPVWTPDYSDERLVAALERFVAAMGERYDGDPRVGYVTAGLLGIWGEWHNWPRSDDFWAPKETQRRVLEAFEKSFRRVPVLLRYPTAGEPQYASTAGRPFGYHDDSFAFATMPTGEPDDSWYFLTRLKAAGLEDAWRTQPIGGEVRPEVWGCAFDDPPCTPDGQSFTECVEATHATWLMETGLNEKPVSDERGRRARRMVARMGYEFHLTDAEVSLADGTVRVQTHVQNRGVAPFYREGFKVRVGLVNGAGELATDGATDWSLLKLLPGDEPREWSATLAAGDLPAGDYRVVIGVPPTFAGGRWLKFANATQDADREGWVTVGEVTVQ